MQVERDPSPDPSSRWLCPECGAANGAAITHCGHCGNARPADVDSGNYAARESTGAQASSAGGGCLHIAAGVGAGVVALVASASVLLSTDSSLEGRGNLSFFYGCAAVAGVLGAVAFRKSPAFGISYLVSYEVLMLLASSVYSSRAAAAVLFAALGFGLMSVVLQLLPIGKNR